MSWKYSLVAIKAWCLNSKHTHCGSDFLCVTTTIFRHLLKYLPGKIILTFANLNMCWPNNYQNLLFIVLYCNDINVSTTLVMFQNHNMMNLGIVALALCLVAIHGYPQGETRGLGAPGGRRTHGKGMDQGNISEMQVSLSAIMKMHLNGLIIWAKSYSFSFCRQSRDNASDPPWSWHLWRCGRF